MRDDIDSNKFPHIASADGNGSQAGPDKATENGVEVAGEAELEQNQQVALLDNNSRNVNENLNEHESVEEKPQKIFVKLERQPSLMRQILHREGAMRQLMPTNQAERFYVQKKHGHDSWQHKLLEFVHSKPVQITLAALLLLDVCILFTDLFLDAAFPGCDRVIPNAISCCNNDSNLSLAVTSYTEDHDLCHSPLVESPENTAACDPHKYPWLHSVHAALFWSTFVILSIFLTELILLIIVLGFSFFKHWFYILDLFIILVSLTLELAFYFVQDEILAELAELLILSRVWRFVRIGHGLVEATAEAFSVTHEVFHDYVDELEELVNKSGIEIPNRVVKIREKVHKMMVLED